MADIVNQYKARRPDNQTRATDPDNPDGNPDDDAAGFEADDDFLNGGSVSKVFDPSVEMYPEPYCSIVDKFTETCFEDSILELFGREGRLDREVFDQLTPESIVGKLNGDMVR